MLIISNKRILQIREIPAKLLAKFGPGFGVLKGKQGRKEAKGWNYNIV
jgi:hypothetical protein